jgi:hypothetical protein
MSLQTTAAQAFARFASDLDGKIPAPDRVAELFQLYLADIRVDALPAPAQAIWADVGKLLKADAQRRPLPAKSIAAITSWPAVRVIELLAALHRIHVALDAAENDTQNDEIRIQVARAYL